MTTSPTKSATDLIPVGDITALVAHPLAEMFSLISEDELKELAEDIRKNGMLEAITLCEGKILDGRNRFAAAKLIGFALRRHNFRELRSDLDPRTFVISATIKRRHLSREDRAKIIAMLLKAEPAKSNRQIAETAKVDDKTVGAVRAKLEATAEIPQLENTTGKDAKPARRRRAARVRAKTKPSPSQKWSIPKPQLMPTTFLRNICSMRCKK
jgi:ParB/Sulfiredoxin domain